MRRLLIVLALVAFSSAPTLADSIELDENARATFTASQRCTFNCTETISVNFIYVPPPTLNVTPEDFLVTVVPATIDGDSSDFLGPFSTIYDGGVVNSQGYVGFSGSSGGEVDLNILSNNGFQPGINTADFDLFFRESHADNPCVQVEEIAYSQTYTVPVISPVFAEFKRESWKHISREPICDSTGRHRPIQSDDEINRFEFSSCF
jgi:hypothetical protein